MAANLFGGQNTQMINYWHYQSYFSETWKRAGVQKLVCWSHQLA